MKVIHLIPASLKLAKYCTICTETVFSVVLPVCLCSQFRWNLFVRRCSKTVWTVFFFRECMSDLWECCRERQDLAQLWQHKESDAVSEQLAATRSSWKVFSPDHSTERLYIQEMTLWAFRILIQHIWFCQVRCILIHKLLSKQAFQTCQVRRTRMSVHVCLGSTSSLQCWKDCPLLRSAPVCGYMNFGPSGLMFCLFASCWIKVESTIPGGFEFHQH